MYIKYPLKKLSFFNVSHSEQGRQVEELQVDYPANCDLWWGFSIFGYFGILSAIASDRARCALGLLLSLIALPLLILIIMGLILC